MTSVNQDAQAHKHREMHSAALGSVLASGFLVLIKIIVGLNANSLAILAEAAHSGIDFVATIITFAAVKISAKPADKDHNFGHGKFENFSALIETVLLWVTVAWVLWEAINRLLGKSSSHVDLSVWAFLVLILSLLIDFGRAANLKHVAKKYDSPALAADALHFHNDMYTSASALLGLVGVFFGFVYADAISGIVISIWTFIMSLELIKDSFDQLMDKCPAETHSKITGILSTMPEVLEVSEIMSRKVGASIFVDLTIGLSKDMSFEHSHRITEQVENSIKEAFPRAKVIVHAEPV